MRASDILIEAIKGFEGFRAEAYKCPAGVWTIGYGHTAGVKKGQKVSKAQAEELLRKDLSRTEDYVNKLGVCKMQGQFDALVDFAYNIGMSALGSSTLIKKIRAGAPTAEIQAQFRRWVYAGKKLLPGLVRRREWEAKRWTE